MWDESQLNEIIKNLAFMIAHDLPQTRVSAKTWEGLEYYTEALDAYHRYAQSGRLEDLFLAGNFSLKSISCESNYKQPFDLLALLELNMLSIGRQMMRLSTAIRLSISILHQFTVGATTVIRSIFWANIMRRLNLTMNP